MLYSSLEVNTSSEKTTIGNEIPKINIKPTTLNSSDSTTNTTKSLNKSSSIEVLPTTLSKVNDTHSTEFENSDSTDDDSYITVIDEGKGTFLLLLMLISLVKVNKFLFGPVLTLKLFTLTINFNKNLISNSYFIPLWLFAE